MPNAVRRTLDEIERDHILQVLVHCAGNRTRSAKLLGISIRGLRMKLAAYARDGHAVPGPLPWASEPGPQRKMPRRPCLDAFIRHHLGLELHLFYDAVLSGPLPSNLADLAARLLRLEGGEMR
jgi:hypothetical protein